MKLALVAICLLLSKVSNASRIQNDKGSSDRSLDTEERNCELVSSRGLMYSCDIFPERPQSDTSVLLELPASQRSQVEAQSANLGNLGMMHYPSKIAARGEGAVVYVVTTALPPFVSQVLPGITKPFKLVTGDSDQGPIDVLGADGFHQLVSQPKLIHWFGQNADDGEENYEKFSQTPIGLDYHTLKAASTSWGPQAKPKAQEALLLSKRNASFSFQKRKHKAFWCGRQWPERASKTGDMPSSFVESAGDMPRADFWDSCGTYQFVISLPGNGIDCHRTWEAIALGAIPIVSDRLRTLYEKNGINVITLGEDEWKKLATPAVQTRLQAAAAKGQHEMPPAMYLKYWVERFQAA